MAMQPCPNNEIQLLKNRNTNTFEIQMKKTGCFFFFSKCIRSSENVWSHKKKTTSKSEQKTNSHNLFNYKRARPSVFIDDFVPQTRLRGLHHIQAMANKRSIETQINWFLFITGQRLWFGTDFWIVDNLFAWISTFEAHNFILEEWKIDFFDKHIFFMIHECKLFEILQNKINFKSWHFYFFGKPLFFNSKHIQYKKLFTFEWDEAASR